MRASSSPVVPPGHGSSNSDSAGVPNSRFDDRSRYLNVASENSEMRASITANTIPLPSYPCDENA